MFHDTLKKANEGWIKQLRQRDIALRKNKRNRMDEIIKKHSMPYHKHPDDGGPCYLARSRRQGAVPVQICADTTPPRML